ncbi:MAG: DUF192 domain-containing protein [Xanthomonadales bacterium]|nr:DUF192 domain-containing protein [Xanthomonadales bacterium]
MRTIFLTGLLACLAACAPGGPSVVLKDQRFYVEIADDPGEQQMGLMFRNRMGEDRGMLFIFERDEPRSFWMKNTRISLDILYFDSGLSLVSMQQDVPPCRRDPCPSYPSTGPARYVLEINAGIAERLGVEVGDLLVLDLD